MAAPACTKTEGTSSPVKKEAVAKKVDGAPEAQKAAAPAPAPATAPAPAAAQKAAASAPAAAQKAAAAPVAAPAAPSVEAAPSSGPVVKLLSPGAEPRKVLRFKFHKDREEKISMEMGTEIAMEMNDMKLPAMKMPAMKMVMSTRITEIRADGDARYEFKVAHVEVVENPDVMPLVLQTMKESAKGLEGFSGYGIVDTRGVTKEADFEIPKEATAQVRQLMTSMRQSIKELSAPLPVEAVGVGARWEVHTVVDQSGMKLLQVATYELIKLDGDKGTTKVTLKQTAPGGDFAPAGSPPGVIAHIDALSSGGSGSMTFDLSRLIPVHSDVRMDMDMAMTVKQGDQSQQMKMKMGLDVKMDAVK